MRGERLLRLERSVDPGGRGRERGAQAMMSARNATYVENLTRHFIERGYAVLHV